MFKPVLTLGPATLAVLMLAACASSGPTYSAYTLRPVNGLPTHQVTCYGVLENRHACEREAQKICAGEPVNVLQAMAPLNSSADGEPNDRVMVFQCGTPAAPPVPPPPTAPPVQSGSGLPMRSSSPARHRAARTNPLSPAALLRQRNPSGRLSQPAPPSAAPPPNRPPRPGSAAPWGPAPSMDPPAPAAPNAPAPGPQDHEPPPLPRRVPSPPAPQFRGFQSRPEPRSRRTSGPGAPNDNDQGTQTA